MSGGIDGLEADLAFFASLPEAARDELKTTLDEIAKAVLAEQEKAVPVGKTGKLKAALTIDEQMERLRVRVGLPQLKARSKVFYGRFVEYGRSAQVVTVIRGTSANKADKTRKRNTSALTNGAIRKPYRLPVKALPARPFVHIESRVDAVIDRYLDRFWSETLAKAGAQGGTT